MSFRRTSTRSSPRRGGGGRPYRPSREWIALDGVPFNAVSSTATAVALYSFQAPTVTMGTALNFDPPEDLTLLRLRGSMLVTISDTGAWALALTVQDTAWTPGTYITDGDKRYLWTQVYQNLSSGPMGWTESCCSNNPGTQVLFTSPKDVASFDIAPKVRLEAGKALFMVAYEIVGAATMTVTLHSLRILQQRASRAGGR